MIADSGIPSAYSIFCDDIREEQNGKVSLIGIYSGEMTVYGAAPVRIPQLAIYIVYIDDPHSFPKRIKLKVFRKGVEEEVLFEVDVDAPPMPQEMLASSEIDPSLIRTTEMRSILRMPFLEFKEECVIKVRALCGEQEIKAGTLSVKIAALPSPGSL